jgi:hypothetical protein
MSMNADITRIQGAKTAIAAAIAAKGVTVPGGTKIDGMAALIAAITGVDTSDATATAADMLEGKTAYVNGVKVTGSIQAITMDMTINPTNGGGLVINPGTYFGATFTYPGDADFIPANIKAGVNMWDKTGTFTADANAVAADMLSGKTAYVNGALVTGNIASKALATITPGTSDQVIAAGQYLTGAQTILGDADLIAGNIKSGANIFGVAGAAAVVDTSTGDAVAANILSGKKAFVNGALVTGNIASKTGQTYTPGTTDQTISSGQYLSGNQVISGDADLIAGNIKSGANIFGVAGASAVKDTSDANAIAAEIATGKTAYVNGTKITGTAQIWKSQSGQNGAANSGAFTVTGLGFTPRIIVGQINGAHILAYGDLLDDAGAAKDFLQMLTSSPWYSGTATCTVGAGTFTMNLKTSAGTAWSPTGIDWYAAGY